MQASAFIFEAIAGLVLFSVGVRVLATASRGAGEPARLLGRYLLLAGISYALYTVPLMFETGDLFTPITYAGRVIYNVSVYFALEFTRSVFRGRETWARGLVTALMLALIVGVGVSSMQGQWDGYTVSSPWFWCEWLGYTLTPLWIGIEGLLAHASARRRARLGLCDPIVANRYLLWGLFGMIQVFASLVIVPMYAGYEENQQFTLAGDAALGGLEMLAAGVAWLAFCTPRYYGAWIARRAAAAAVKGG
ncbi:MAG TPA: hypothetical protein VEC18_06145 [Myxococcota bacterium]|nr:hypothetical protein [Myxococcota bacterium]